MYYNEKTTEGRVVMMKSKLTENYKKAVRHAEKDNSA